MAFDGLKATQRIYDFTYISGADTGEIVSNAASIIHAVTLNTAGTTSSTIQINDSASNTSDTTQRIASLSTTTGAQQFVYEAHCANGIYARHEGGTPGAVLITYVKV